MAIPSNLGPRATDTWNAITSPTSGYVLRPDELIILEEACREIDTIERLEAELAAGEITTVGSMGQEVAAPALSEIRQHRNTLRALLKQLDLPDTGDGRNTNNSSRASKAANARWRR